MTIEWNEQFKIRLASCNEAMDKHDIVKTLLVRMLKRKHKRELTYILIYTERSIDLNEEERRIVDIFFQNNKNKEIYCFEIQKEDSKEWTEKTVEFYKKYDESILNLYMKKNLIIVPIKKLSDNIPELKEQLEEYVI